jgi:hypothetical protein
MRLPNGDHAIIDSRKVTDYRLNPDHDDGKHKARLFHEKLGLKVADAQYLLEALKKAAAHNEVVIGKQDKYGQRHVIDFECDGPTGKALVRSAWIIRADEGVPRLVTCYIL